MERIAMSQEERDQLEWLKRVKSGSMTQREAAQKMGVSDRWVRILLKRMSKQGDAVVVHGLRGRPSNRKLAAETERQAVAILKQLYQPSEPELSTWPGIGTFYLAPTVRRSTVRRSTASSIRRTSSQVIDPGTSASRYDCGISAAPLRSVVMR